MKIFKNVFVLLLTVVILFGCSKENENTIFDSILDGSKTFINEEGNSTYLSDVGSAKEYVYIDLDGDKEEELILEIENGLGDYLILHNNIKLGNIYGYIVGVRTLEDLKEDGSFVGSNGANNQDYCTIEFDEDKMNVVLKAEYHFDENIFTIGGKDVSEDEINKYIDEFSNKKSVEWKELEN